MRVDHYRYTSTQDTTHVTDWDSIKADMFKADIAIRLPWAKSLCVCKKSQTSKILFVMDR
jgi:hypothetical protein